MKGTTEAAGIVLSLALLAAVWPTHAAEEGQTTDKVFAEPTETEALVYFMREGIFSGSAIAIFVFSDTQLVTVVPNNSYTFAHMNPGKHILWWGRNYPGQEVEFEAGEVYYMDLTPSMKKRDRFMDEESAKDLLEKIKFYYVPTEEKHKKADKFLKKNYAKVMALPPETAGARKHCPYPESLGPVATSASIAIRPIELACSSPYPQDVTEEWSIELPKLLKKQLRSNGYDHVTILNDEERANADVIIEGKFVQLKKGSGWGRITGASAKDAAFMRVDFSLDGKHSDAPIEVACSRTGYGLGGVAFGALSGSSKRIMHNNMERIAERLAEIFVESTIVEKPEYEAKKKRKKNK